MERIACEGVVFHPTVIQIGKAGVDPLYTINNTTNAPKLITCDRHATQKMTGTMRLDNNVAEPRRNRTGQEKIVGDIEGAERKFGIELWRRVLFICPFNKAVVDVVPRHDATAVVLGNHQTSGANTVGNVISLKEMIALYQTIGTRDHREMSEFGRSTILQLDVVGVCVQRDG